MFKLSPHIAQALFSPWETRREFRIPSGRVMEPPVRKIDAVVILFRTKAVLQCVCQNLAVRGMCLGSYLQPSVRAKALPEPATSGVADETPATG